MKKLLILAMLIGSLVVWSPAPAQAIRFNPCAELDLSRISEQINGVTYKYCWKRKTFVMCGLRLKYVRDWQRYRVGNKPLGCRNSW